MKIPSIIAVSTAILGAVDASKRGTHHIVAEIVTRSQEESGYLLPLEERPVSFRGGRINCGNDGKVRVPDNGEEYDCNGIDFLSFISSDELKIPGTQYQFQSSDIWGWTSPEGREITLLTMDTGIVFIDSTNALDPFIIAKSHSSRPPAQWGDVKVVGSFAYTIKDRRTRFEEFNPGTGMEIYNLTKIDEIAAAGRLPVEDVPLLNPDYITPYHGACHNVVSSTEANRIYAVGCRDTCDGGLIILDVAADPLKPPMIGCVFQDGYTHDAQCVKYSGPDRRYTGQEICFAFNEDTLTIWDVTDARKPDMLSRTFYNNQAFSHQGWLNKDMTKIMHDDELDELCNLGLEPRCPELVKGELSGIQTTSTNIFDITDLRNPFVETVFDFGTNSIDHNLYEWGTIQQRGWDGSGPQARIADPNFAYMHNYMSGLRVVDISSGDATQWREVKHFQFTDDQEPEFFGVWSGYMFPSGTYAISSIEKGLFFLDTNADFVDAPPLPDFPPRIIDSSEDSQSTSPALYVFFFIFLGMAIGIGFLLKSEVKKQRAAKGSGDTAQVQQATL